MSTYTTYNNKLEAFKNNSKDLVVIVYDASGNLMDLTDYAGYIYMQKFPIRPDNPIDVSIAAISKDPSNGALYFKLYSSELNITPGDYVYEVIIDDGSTNRHTVIQDKLNLKNSIS